MSQPGSAPAHAGIARSEIATLLSGYWAFGQYWGVWVVVIAAFNRERGISDGLYGLSLTVLSVSAVLVMAFVAPRMAGLSLNVTVPLSLLTLGVGSFATALLPASLLWLGYVLVGAGNGLIDVFLNVDAEGLEQRTGKPVLQWLHASYAFGGITGALLAGAISLAGGDVIIGMVAAAVALFVCAWANSRRMPRGGDPAVASAFSLSAFRQHRGLLVPGMIVLFAFLVEGSMDTWSGKYVQEELGASQAQSALVFVVFSASLFAGRLFAGRVLYGLGRRRTVLISGFGAAASGALAALTSSPLVVGLAFLVMGFAISAVAPAGFGMVETVAPNDRANAITAVTTVGYSGFVWSPPLFGWIAQSYGLRTAMIVIVSGTAGIVVGGLMARRDPPAGGPSP
jgi:hypothetical protein